MQRACSNLFLATVDLFKVRYICHSLLVKDDELDRIKLAFKRSPANSNLMAKTVFISDVLGDVMPKRLAEVSLIKNVYLVYVICLF